MDYGGIKREFFTIAIKDIINHTDVLAPCSNGRLLWFTNLSCNQTDAAAEEASASAARKMPRLNHTSDVTQGDAASISRQNSSSSGPGNQEKYSDLKPKRRLAYYLGLIAGMATYNGVHVDVPLPSCVYKIMKGQEVPNWIYYSDDIFANFIFLHS